MLPESIHVTSITAPSQPVKTSLDHDVALARAGGDVVLLREIAMLFLENYAKWMSDLRDAVTRGDTHGVERGAHGLKGSVANFGATAAVEAALQLEQAGRGKDLTEVEKVLNSLELALAALHPELEAL
jgi:HPt (histidine-containing phosphotransfer) domain-containing protein